MLVCLNRCTVFLSVCIDTTGPLSSRELFWFSGEEQGVLGEQAIDLRLRILMDGLMREGAGPSLRE